jgi:uncharacterized membrane protein
MNQKHRSGRRIQAKKDANGLEAQIEEIEEYSPYPPAEFLQQLNLINPELVHRVMLIAEQEQKHRHAVMNEQIIEAKRVNTAHIEYDQLYIKLMARGQWFGLALALGLVTLAAYTAYLHESWAASTAILAIVGILVVYVLLKVPKQQPNDKKSDE